MRAPRSGSRSTGPSIAELRQVRAEKVDRMEELTEKRDLSGSEEREFETLMSKSRELRDQIREAVRDREAEREKLTRELLDTEKTNTDTRAKDLLDRDTYKRTDAFIRGEARAADQSIGAKAEGGALASTGLFPIVAKAQKRVGGVRRTRAEIIQTDHGRDMNLPGMDDTSNEASIVAEGSTRSASKIDLSDVSYTAHTYQAGIITLTQEQIQDSETDVVDLVMDTLGERIARATESDYAASTAQSSTAPNGIVTLSTGAVSVVAGSTTVNFDALRNLFFNVDPAYREQGEWAVSDEAFEDLSNLEDADGRPLLEPSLQQGLGTEILGRPVRVVEGIGNPSTDGEKPVLFGDFRRAFSIRDVTSVRMQRLDERFAEQRRVGFLAWFRTDSKPRFSSTIAASQRPVRAIVTTT